jgi:hypothetical protein
MDNLLPLELTKVFTTARLVLHAPFVAVFQFLIALRPAFLWKYFCRTATRTNTQSMLVLEIPQAVPTPLSFALWHLT